VWFHAETDVTTPVAICFSKRLKEVICFMSEELGHLPNEKTMSRDFEEEYVATSRPKCDEIMGAWEKLRNNELHNLFLSAKYS